MPRLHNPLLEQRLRRAVTAHDATALCATLKSLSCADFRTAGHLLATKVLLENADDEAFWSLFAATVPTNAKAYLGTFLKAAVGRAAKHRQLSLQSAALEQFAASASPIDCRKTLAALLPLARSSEDAERLLRLFAPTDDEACINLLLKLPSPLAAYHLFLRLRTLEGQTERLRAVCVALMKRGDSVAFNLAAIIQTYFSLPPLPGTFSLHIEPYELSRLEASFEGFKTYFQR